MKRPFLFLFLLASFVSGAYAQIPVTVSSIVDPGTIAERLADAERFAQTIQNAIQQLQTASQALQYQIQAAQDLGQGGWNGFVKAFDDEEAAISSYTSLVDNMPSLSDIAAVNDLINTQGYQAAKVNLDALNTRWYNADQAVHQTDTLFKNTATRENLWAQIQDQSQNGQNKNSTVSQLQLLDQQLGLLGGEMTDVHATLASYKQYEVALREQQDMARRVQVQQMDNYYTGTAFASENWPHDDSFDVLGDLQ